MIYSIITGAKDNSGFMYQYLYPRFATLRFYNTFYLRRLFHFLALFTQLFNRESYRKITWVHLVQQDVMNASIIEKLSRGVSIAEILRVVVISEADKICAQCAV